MRSEKLIEDMFQELFQSFGDWNMSEDSIRIYDYTGVRIIRKYYEKAGIIYYNKAFMSQIKADVSNKFKDGVMTKSTYDGVIKVSDYLNNYNNGFEWKRRRTGSKVALNSRYYADLHDAYREYEQRMGLYSESRIIHFAINIRHFFRWLEDNECETLEQLSLESVSDFLTHYGKIKPCTVGAMGESLRKLDIFVKQNGIASIDFAPALTFRPASRQKLMPTFSHSEAESIVAAVDTDTSTGKRNFAILMVAKELGVRTCDIMNLKLKDIYWESYEIRFRQSKTKVELILPLEPIVGNAIADYILNGRPKTDAPHVFVRSRAPYVKMTSMNNILAKYAPGHNREPRSGFHSFRRGLLSRLLNAGVSTDEAKNIAGHTNIDSLKPYARTSEERLKSCALGLKGIETKVAVLR